VPAQAAVSFNPAQNSATGNAPEGLVSDAFTPTGAPDIAAAFQGGATSGTSILLNNGAGTFPGTATTLADTSELHNLDVATGDFNNDGKPDLLAAGRTSPFVELHLGDGGGGFGAGLPVAGAAASNGVAAGFFNSDGNLDFAAAPFSGNTLQVFLGNGNGTFAAPTTFPLPSGTTAALPLADDLTTDGRDELAVVDGRGASNAELSVLRFGPSGFVDTAGSPFDLGFSGGGAVPGLAAGDLNNDGNDDLAVADNAIGGGVRVLLGNGDGSVKPPVAAATGAQDEDVAIADLDNDGNQDLALVRTGSGLVTISLGNGTGTGFTAGGTLTPAPGALHIVSDDFNRDGNPDLATSNEGSGPGTGTISVFLAKPPTVSVSPGSLAFGNQNVGTTSATQTVTLTNNGPQTIGPVASITGSDAGDFERIDDHCSPASVFLGPGASCTVGVRFRPGSSGDKQATLELASNAAGNPQKVPLTGTGVPPASTTPVVPIIDRTPPRQTVSIPRQTVRSVLRDGLIMFAACSEPCAFRADVLVRSSTKKPRRRRGRAARTVTAGAANALLGTQRHRVVVRIRKSARRALTRTRKLTLVTTATDSSGNASSARRGLKLRRR
jgi:hypothetical protein